MKLTEENKHKFEQQVHKISDKDETEVRQKIIDELISLEKIVLQKPSNKMQELLNNAKLMYEILCNEEFPISDSSKKWIVFGLRYLVSDLDLIPDGIPIVGYMDDAMIVNWVVYMIDSDITRYQVYKRLVTSALKGGLIKSIKKGKGDIELILIPGLISNYLEVEMMDKWAQHLTDLPTYQYADISVLGHAFTHLGELNKTLKVVDHDLRLKPVYDFDAFQIDWEQANLECMYLSKALATDLKLKMEENPNKNYAIIAFDLGSKIMSSMLSDELPKQIEKLFIMGGVSCNLCNEANHLKNVSKVFNFYSESDYALKFIFDNVEKNQKPIGMQPLFKTSLNNVENINVSNEVKNHFEYKFKLHLLIDQSC